MLNKYQKNKIIYTNNNREINLTDDTVFKISINLLKNLT